MQKYYNPPHRVSEFLEKQYNLISRFIFLKRSSVLKGFCLLPNRIVINTILHILPSFATYGCLLLFVFYFFAIIGMEIFAGKINYGPPNCGNPKLNVSTLHFGLEALLGWYAEFQDQS